MQYRLRPPYPVLIAVSVLCGVQIYNLALTLFHPFRYYSVEVLTPKVHAGECVEEALDVQRYRVCRVEIDRFVVNDETKRVIFRERVPGGSSPLGRTPKVVNFVCLPRDIKPGHMTLIQNSHSHCIDGMHSMEWPTLHFEVVE
jgi:hypothetical protein